MYNSEFNLEFLLEMLIVSLIEKLFNLETSDKTVGMGSAQTVQYYPREIDYFAEEKMNENSHHQFVETLPEYLKARFDKKNTANSAVLQEYQRTSSFGVEIISYWYGMSNLLHILPVVGSAVFGIIRAVESGSDDLKWQKLFF
jgi:hypothetical protein